MRKYNYEFLSEGWLELESDPSTFTLLIEDLGCFGAQVDEIYDLEQKFEGPVYGFIFLFKWLNNNQPSDRGSRSHNVLTSEPSAAATPKPIGQAAQIDQHQHATRNILNNTRTRRTTAMNNNNNTSKSKNNFNTSHSNNSSNQKQQKQQYHDADKSTVQPNPWSYVADDNIVNEIFFAKQMISNSCATHALISVLLNCDRGELDLGQTLTDLKEYTRVMAPEDKGYAISNLPLIAKAHNSHASYLSLYCRDRPNQQRGLSFAIRGNQRTNLQQLQNQPETYHFVSYVPIKNRLYELDGLKNYPIDHGPLDPNEDWTEKFRRVIRQRLLENTSHGCDPINDIRYNLMAVVPDKRVQLRKQAVKLKRHLSSVKESLKQLERGSAKNETNHKTTSTYIHGEGPPFSPVSNGTLTASETGSTCADSPVRSQDAEQGDLDIPNPPYSPISTDTLSASETGSTCNSPSRFYDSFFLEEKNSIDKHYFIRFGPPEVADRKTDEGNREGPSDSSCHDVNEQKLAAIADMKRLLKQLERDIEKNESLLKEENDKRRKYKIDNSRRTHNYEPFIMTFLSMLAKQGNLAQLIEKDLGITTEGVGPKSPASKPSTKQQQQQPPPPQQPQTSRSTKRTTLNLPSHQKAISHHNNKLKQNGPKEPPKTLTSISGRPIRATKSKYISTGRPRGRPRKTPS